MLLFLSLSCVCAADNETGLEDVSINADDVSMHYRNGTRLNVDLTDSNDQSLSNQSVIININRVNYTRTTDTDGKASIAINLLPGKYLSNIYFLGTNKYSSSSKQINVEVLPTISGDDLTKYYRNDSQYYATFLDGMGNPLSFADVTFNINGVFYTRQSNEDGVARLNINLAKGDYIITAYNPNDGFAHSNSIKVLPTVNGSDLVKIYRDSHQYWATFRDSRGNPLSNSNVEFNVNGVIYTRQSNEYGNAKLNINLGPGNYIITAHNKINGELSSNNIVVYGYSETKLTTQDYSFRLNDDDTITATLTNRLNYGIAGEVIKLNADNNTYSALTDENGVAKFYPGLAQGNHSLKFTHDATSVYGASQAISNVENYNGTRAIINADDDIIFINDKYSVSLYDENSTPFKNQSIFLKVGQNIYSAVTDDVGVATFNVTSGEGKYEAIVFYNGTGYKFTRKIVSLFIVDDTKTSIVPYTSSVTEGRGEKFNVYLSSNSIKLPNKEVIISVNGRNYTKTTNEDGIASLTINLSPNSYDMKFYFLGDDFFKASSNSSLLTVVPRIYTQISLITPVHYKGSEFTFNLKLKADKGLSGRNITFTIGSNTYNQITDDDGVIHLNINDLAVGKYYVTYSFAGDYDYAPFTGASTLEVTSQTPYGYGYWVRYGNMNDVDFDVLASHGTKQIILHSYAFTAYGENNVVHWIKQANDYGMKVHIWMQVAYYGGWSTLSNRDGSYNYDLINSKIDEARYYAGVPGVSGVHFDYLRFPGTAHNYPNAADSINYFVINAVAAIKQVNPNCQASAAIMPEPSSMIYYYGQDYTTLSRYLDFIAPMVYKGNYNSGTSWIGSVTKWFVANSKGAEVWTGLQAYRSDDDVTPLSVSELANDAQTALNSGAKGIIMFRWGATNFIDFDTLVRK
ncbi:MAG: Ig-like domain repeat protein [Methanobrevibacter sp.]|uniref:Ig-like domain repeat protein n=1 Tax=Methanobrevibacter sp. TaxID=66852 RepID=UPI00260093BC|nr:Ig-like domain repeat protein [Methanobrevibacter sp.]MBR0271295.1 Ig-like domain repeat protein [Methanobrevibacter sp.]